MSAPIANFLKKHKHRALGKTPLKLIYRKQAAKISYYQTYVEKKYLNIDNEVPPAQMKGDEESIETISEFLVDYSIALLILAGVMYYAFRDPIPAYLRRAEAKIDALEDIVGQMNKKQQK